MGNLLSGNDNCWEGTPNSGKKQAAFTAESTKHIKLLFGCQNFEEHLEYVEEVCDLIADKHGEEGLAILGLEFRYIADTKSSQAPSNDTQFSSSSEWSLRRRVQEEEEKKKQDYEYSMTTHEEEHAPDHISISDDNIGDGRKTDSKDSRQYRRAISDVSSDVGSKDDDGSTSDEERDLSFAIRQMSIDRKEFLVPIGEPISRVNSSNEIGFGVRMGSDRTLQTATTMFSLTTHQSRTSSSESRSSAGTPTSPSGYLLFHKSTNTLITEKNHQLFIAHGKMYDEAARLSMEYAQDLMMKEGNLEWQSMGDGVNAIVTRNRSFQRPLLLIVTGKGKVGAGIFSRRHLMTSGIETSTALPFVQDAIKRKMDVAILDPNGSGTRNAMQSVKASLESLFLEHGATDEDVYILAHSMAGSQIVRVLHDKTFDRMTSSTTTNAKEIAPIARSSSKEFQIQTGMNFLQQIKAVAFTDSNHNINWTEHNPPLKELIEGPSSLYIKSHKVHEDAKKLGELHHDCNFWKHRFGTVKTIWAGTNEHALTNYAGMQYIWDHFDDFLEGTDGG